MNCATPNPEKYFKGVFSVLAYFLALDNYEDFEMNDKMNDEIETKPNMLSEAIKTALATVPETFAELVALGKDSDTLLQFRPTVRTLLLNGCGDVYTDNILPMLRGQMDLGSFAANKAILGLKLIEADAAKDNLLSKCRPPKGKAINPATVGNMIDSIIKDSPLQFGKRSMVVVETGTTDR